MQDIDDRPEPPYTADPAIWPVVWRRDRRTGKERWIEGHRCPDCGGVNWDDGVSRCVCDGEGVHWEG